jgi:hypothetical protein
MLLVGREAGSVVLVSPPLVLSTRLVLHLRGAHNLQYIANPGVVAGVLLYRTACLAGGSAPIIKTQRYLGLYVVIY